MRNPKRTLTLRILERILSLRTLKRNLLLRTLERTLLLNTLMSFKGFCAVKKYYGILVVISSRSNKKMLSPFYRKK